MEGDWGGPVHGAESGFAWMRYLHGKENENYEWWDGNW